MYRAHVTPIRKKIKVAKILFTCTLESAIIILLLKDGHGGIAQLGERLNGIQEVSGSIPLISTKNLVLRNGVFYP